MKLDLQLTYLVTPVTEDILGDVSKGQSGQWAKFLDIYGQLVDRDQLLRRIAECCGITSDFYNRCLHLAGHPAFEKPSALIARFGHHFLPIHTLEFLASSIATALR